MDILRSLDTLLSLMMVYLIFALGVSALNELIAAAWSSRAKWLTKGIEGLLKGSEVTTAQVYASPFLSALARPGNADSASGASYLRAWSLVQGVLDAASSGKAVALTTIDEVDSAIEKLGRSPIGVVLKNLRAQADGNLDTFRMLVEKWFKTFEEQVIAWYRRKTHLVIAALSFAMALALNLDTFAILRALSVDSRARDALVQEAVDAAGKDGPSAVLDLGPLRDARATLEAARSGNADEKAINAARKDVETEIEALDAAIRNRIEQLGALRLPIGWSHVDLSTLGFTDVLTKLFGIVLTAGALSLGAPFWFDAVQKVVTIRSVGKNLLERRADANRHPGRAA